MSATRPTYELVRDTYFDTTDGALRERRMRATPLGTEGTGWDVAWAAVYLASDEARWITGVVIPVDAGLTITSPVTYSPLAPQQQH